MTRRAKSIVVALIGLLVLVSAGAIVLDRTDGPVIPAYGGTYVEGIAGVPQYLNPIIAATNVDQDVSALVFSGLTRYDRGGTIVPDLARSFSTDPEGKVWRFTLRSDATWHDGAEVTADDVVYTVGLLQDKAYVGPFRDAFRGVSVARVDAKTVTFTLAGFAAVKREGITLTGSFTASVNAEESMARNSRSRRGRLGSSSRRRSTWVPSLSPPSCSFRYWPAQLASPGSTGSSKV